VTSDVRSSVSPSDDSEHRPARQKKHIAGMAFGFLTPLLLIAFALERHVKDDALLVFALLAPSVPVIFLGIRSYQRWFYPDRMPTRWSRDSAALRWVRAAELAAAGVNLVAWLAVGLMNLGQEASRHKSHLAWLAVIISASIRLILMQYREDRKPMPPLVPLSPISPHDLSLRLTNAIRPVYSKEWDRFTGQ
jgi:hypothetical protein